MIQRENRMCPYFTNRMRIKTKCGEVPFCYKKRSMEEFFARYITFNIEYLEKKRDIFKKGIPMSTKKNCLFWIYSS